VEQLGSSLGS